jgi:hypothetical protein
MLGQEIKIIPIIIISIKNQMELLKNMEIALPKNLLLTRGIRPG